MKKIFYLLFSLFCVSVINACNKSDKNPGNPQSLTGHIYFSWADEGVQRLNMSSLEKELILPPDTKRNGFDISRNQQKLLVLSDIQGDYDHEEIRIIDLSTSGVIISQKLPSGDHSGFTNPRLSYDENYILATSLLPDRVIVMDLQNNQTFILQDFQGDKFKEAVWMPDGSVLLCTADAIYQSAIPFDEVKLIKKLSFDSWHSLAVSPDGSRIAFAGGNHIYMLNTDGSNLTQVSAGSGQEGAPAFSSDGKFLVAGMRQFSGGAGPWGNYYTMFIFPADGNKYHVGEGQSSGEVRMIIPKNERSVQAYQKKILWL